MIAAVVPAAGKSERMGRPKLLIEIAGEPLLARVVTALASGGACPVIVVAPPRSQPEGPPIIALAERLGAIVVAPDDRPADMRASIQLGLDALRATATPQAVILTPADAPGISQLLIELLIEEWRARPDRIVIPTFEGRRGHPVVLPWSIVSTLESLPHNLGLNALIAAASASVHTIEVADRTILLDLDVPADLEFWDAPTAAPGMVVHCVRLFASARELAGTSELEVALAPGGTVADLRRAIAHREPRLRLLAETALIAVDEEYHSDDAVPQPGARIALIPPVSGGETNP